MVRSIVALLVLLAPVFSAPAASRYVADAAGAPVKWEAWGPRALERAKKEKRPIFLSIAYVSSYEAFRMQREAFVIGEVAETLNAYFVPVLLDRFEHPEIAETFETIARSMNVPAGWPVLMVLTPSLEPFRATGYLEPGDLNRMLVIEANRWANENAAVLAEAHTNVMKARLMGEKRAPAAIDPHVLDDVMANIGRSPAFNAPQPMTLSFLLRRKNENAASALRKLSTLAIRDQLGGGFHRAVHDADWRVPYFEKFTADQALVAMAYLDAWQLTRDPKLANEARATLDAALRDLRQPTGGFDASQDAQSLVPAQGPEFWNGAFYVWNKDEVAHLTGHETAPKIFRLFGMTKDTRNILYLEDAGLREDEAVKAGLAKLLDVRQKRPQPFREKTVYAGINGLMISALARAGALLGNRDYVDAAARTAHLIATTLWSAPKKTLIRSSDATAALAEDYALLIQGLLDLFEASYDPRWLELALALQQRQDQLFWDESMGRYTTGTSVPETLRGLLVERDLEMPSANSVSAMNLLRLATLTGAEAWRVRPSIIFQSFGTRLRNDGANLPQLASALSMSLASPKIVAVTGPWRQPAQDLLRSIHERRDDFRIVVFVPLKGANRERILQLLPFTRALAADPEQPIEYECSGGECRRR